MHLNALPDSTRRVLERARGVDGLRDHLLIGGTALALRVAHRISEDLDFVQFGTRLDRPCIASILDGLSRDSTPELVTSLVHRQEFENDGEDIDDVHQDWLVDEVKVTFFCPDRREELDVLRSAKPSALGSVQVADADTIFRLKSMLVAERWTSRDAFDLVHFVEKQGRTIVEIDDLIKVKRPHYTLNARLALLSRPFPLIDQGFQTIDATMPATSESLAARLRSLVERHSREARNSAAELSIGPDSPPFLAPTPSHSR